MKKKDFEEKMKNSPTNNENSPKNEENEVASYEIRDFNDSSNNNFISNENSLFNGQDNINGENDIPNNEDILNLNYLLEQNSKEKKFINANISQNNKNLDNIPFRSTTYQVETINGKQIITSNEMMKTIFLEKFGTAEINETIQDLQMLKKKNKRRKKEEIEKTKESMEPTLKKKKTLGRRKNDSNDENSKDEKIHGKEEQGNIMKKINTSFMEKTRRWMNKSFVDKNLNFQNEKENKKKEQNYFLKLNPTIINNQNKKELRIETLGQKFKDIFSSYPISSLYKKQSESKNKDLINQIYTENNQPFVKYILELTFLDGLNYYNGQITDETVYNYFKKKYNFDEKIISQFINNFDKIGTLFDKLYEKEKGKNSDESLKNYFSKIKVLSLNYKESLETKFERKENKKNKKSENG